MRISGWMITVFLLALLTLQGVAQAQETFTVTDTNDDEGEGTLRWAITEANASTAESPPTIEFNIDIGGLQTITLATELPEITRTMIIDGTTEPGGGGPNIQIIPAGGVSIAHGLHLTGNKITIKGLWIEGFNTGILVEGERNIIGGLVSSDRNVIVRNLLAGIFLLCHKARFNRVEHNYIGTDGAANLGNKWGVLIDRGAHHNEVISNTISGNDGHGIIISGFTEVLKSGEKKIIPTRTNSIIRNFIGTDPTGNTSTIPNGGNGIFIQSSISGSELFGASFNIIRVNVISGNEQDGIEIQEGCDKNRISENTIGTSKDGENEDWGNGKGIRVGSKDTIIAKDNKIKGAVGPDSGLRLSGEGATVAMNVIESNAGSNVHIDGGAKNNIIGPGNIIRFAAHHGVSVEGDETDFNTIRGNSIYQIMAWGWTSAQSMG